MRQRLHSRQPQLCSAGTRKAGTCGADGTQAFLPSPCSSAASTPSISGFPEVSGLFYPTSPGIPARISHWKCISKSPLSRRWASDAHLRYSEGRWEGGVRGRRGAALAVCYGMRHRHRKEGGLPTRHHPLTCDYIRAPAAWPACGIGRCAPESRDSPRSHTAPSQPVAAARAGSRSQRERTSSSTTMFPTRRCVSFLGENFQCREIPRPSLGHCYGLFSFTTEVGVGVRLFPGGCFERLSPERAVVLGDQTSLMLTPRCSPPSASAFLVIPKGNL